MQKHDHLVPTGSCWCECGQATGQDAFFVPGHDQLAETLVIIIHYGGIAQFLAAHGYGPAGQNLMQAYATRRVQCARGER